ncbi:uncharacterized protein LOC143625564 [Bidens hawaiensis]|uniref:uncharacterized protein LOC143625564 n=1 Tax=Bidens hawaiensis TaxID=980011 RepID=UPI00404A1A8A
MERVDPEENVQVSVERVSSVNVTRAATTVADSDSEDDVAVARRILVNQERVIEGGGRGWDGGCRWRRRRAVEVVNGGCRCWRRRKLGGEEVVERKIYWCGGGGGKSGVAVVAGGGRPLPEDVVPQVNASIKPIKGMAFESIDLAYDFYCEYAKKADFCVRKGGSYVNDGILKSKYFTFSKEGRKPPKSYDSMDDKDSSRRPYYKRRKRPTIQCGCKAQIFLKSVDGIKFEINEFVEEHNHAMVQDDSFGVAPKVVVTNQDPAMKQAIASVFSNTRHRLCMWHIMKKLADKVGVALCNNEDFKRKICDIVYDWIPAYYRDEPLSGLMRTTSRSESENHFFCQVSNSQLSPVEFFSYFDHCMEIQRHNSRKNDHDTRYTHPELVSESPIEQEAELIYTRAIFNDFQDEMYHIRSGVASLKSTKEGDYLKFSIFDFNACVSGCLEVLIKKDGEDGVDSIVSCSCKRFEQYGLLCRHILYVLNLFRVKRFPKKYILDRWKRDAGVNLRTAPISNLGNEKNLKVKEISREITLAGEYLINSYVTDIDELTKVRDQMNIMIQKVDKTRYQRTSLSKRDRFAAVLGYAQPPEVTVRVPSGIRNKGRGSHKRIKSQKEIVIGRSGKKHRECKVCNLPSNSRTCPRL